MLLSEQAIGATGVVSGFIEQGSAPKTRYLSLGLIPGSVFKVVRVAPLGCPLQIKVGSTLLSIRKAEAADVLVEIAQ